jgi:hypothetical protein
VLDGAPARLSFDQLDAFVVAQDFDVVANLAQAFAELIGQFLRAGDSFVEDPEDFNAQLVSEGLDKPLIDRPSLLLA